MASFLYPQEESCTDPHGAQDKFLLHLRQVYNIRQPTKRNQNSLHNVIYNTSSLVDSESDWIYYLEDLAAIPHDQESSWLNGFLVDSMRKI